MTKDEQKQFRAQAHSLKPVIMIGQSGLTDAVIAEINLALDSHELIKIKIQENERDQRQQISDQICSSCAADFIQSIGKILVIYRQNPDKS